MRVSDNETVDSAADVLEELDEIVWPELVVPLPEEINPRLDEVGNGVAWAEDMGLLSSPDAVERFSRHRFARLAARTYPRAERYELELMVDWMNWMFLFDDQADDTPWGADPVEWRRRAVPCFDVLEQPDVDNRALPPLARGLGDLMRRSGVGMSEGWHDRLCHHVASGMRAFQTVATARQERRAPDMASFLEGRRDSAALKIVFDLAERVEHVEIPPSLYESPEFQELWRGACDTVAWLNDLYSLRKEAVGGEVYNVVLVIRRAMGCSLQEAVDRAVDMVHARVATYMAARRLVEHLLAASDLSADVRDGVRGCMDIYASWMRGNLDWSRETVRYTENATTRSGALPDYIEPLLRP